ncbi:hypothetical protein [Ruania rhizosphaerae]|uniref:hypothetical protein n=1 Tax=Ruania rhizosphaerae TaxID=1840413 RepID=UPI001359A7F3|nr:hypothetical protein [Ruania rhizosphaerae]
MTVESWWQLADRTQPILNARPVPARRVQCRLTPPVPVVATIVWAVDGAEQLRTVATRWTVRGDVLVRILDDRRRTIGAWVSAGDVERTGTAATLTAVRSG